MRVIAGQAKGIQLQAVPGSGTRPITDRVKEAVFNILRPDIIDAWVLDLFAGTG
ncbi:MAG: RsmD family RNA methyltransferase, partial [Anaerolineae bacterium]